MKTLRINWLGVATGSVNKLLKRVRRELTVIVENRE